MDDKLPFAKLYFCVAIKDSKIQVVSQGIFNNGLGEEGSAIRRYIEKVQAGVLDTWNSLPSKEWDMINEELKEYWECINAPDTNK